jgi:hypothetical protein
MLGVEAGANPSAAHHALAAHHRAHLGHVRLADRQHLVHGSVGASHDTAEDRAYGDPKGERACG